jgi:anti-sigma regulatory factor (Ser/Thr protein kinase)
MSSPAATDRWAPRFSFPLIAGLLAALLGLVVLVGWYTHDLALIHVLPSFVGMAFNAALGFLICGVSLAAVALGRPRIALLGTAFALLIGLPTLIEYATGHDFGLDERLMPAYTRSGVTQMGRMAISTALSFTVLGLAFLRLNLPKDPNGRAQTLGLLGATVAGLGMIALFGYVTGITDAYTWGQLTRMAVHTATGFLLLGGGLVGLAWQMDRQVGGPRWLGALVGIVAAAATLCAWQAVTVQQRAQAALLESLAARAGVGLGRRPATEAWLTAGALGGGLLLTVLLARAVSLAQTARRQAAELGQARDELERRVQERTGELAEANAHLATANRAVRDVVASVTEGRLRLCETAADLPPPLGPYEPPVLLSRQDVGSLRHHVRRIADQVGLTDGRRDDLETAVGEAAMNAVVHGHGGRGEFCTDGHGTVQVWVRDDGSGIAMENLPRATLERGFTTAGSLGHGFWLMLNTVDRVWLLTGPTGTTLVMEQSASPPLPAWLSAALEPQAGMSL